MLQMNEQDKMEIKEFLNKVSADLAGNDKHFFNRVWNSDQEKYRKRLESIGFNNMEMVLDAGFGMGQWMFQLSKVNKEVCGIEFDESRVNVVTRLFNELEVKNVKIAHGSVEELPYPNDYFNAIFCYGVIFIPEIKTTLKEFYRVLKPGGKLYFTANGLGWYYHLILTERNKTNHHDPRSLAFKVLEDSIYFINSGRKRPGSLEVCVPSFIMEKYCKEVGFANIEIDSEGCIKKSDTAEGTSFYEGINFYGYEGIYEILAIK